MKTLALLLGLLALTGCDTLDHQKRAKDYRASGLFRDGKVLQAPPDGTIAQDDPVSRAALATRPPMSAALLARGQQRYAIACAPCHDLAGSGAGTVPDRGYPKPPSFHVERLRAASSRSIVEVITHGHGVMYALADRVSPADRWAIAAYVRALQASQNTDVARLSAEQRAAWGGADGP